MVAAKRVPLSIRPHNPPVTPWICKYSQLAAYTIFLGRLRINIFQATFLYSDSGNSMLLVACYLYGAFHIANCLFWGEKIFFFWKNKNWKQLLWIMFVIYDRIYWFEINFDRMIFFWLDGYKICFSVNKLHFSSLNSLLYMMINNLL